MINFRPLTKKKKFECLRKTLIKTQSALGWCLTFNLVDVCLASSTNPCSRNRVISISVFVETLKFTRKIFTRISDFVYYPLGFMNSSARTNQKILGSSGVDAISELSSITSGIIRCQNKEKLHFCAFPSPSPSIYVIENLSLEMRQQLS